MAKHIKVRISTPVAGLNYSYAPGEVVALPAKQAQRFLSAGIATPVRSRKAETTAAAPAEVASPKPAPGHMRRLFGG